MIRRDYILRMIEEFAQALRQLQASKQRLHWDEADTLLEAELKRLAGEGRSRLLLMSETELLAQILKNGPTHLVREKVFMLASLFQEAGDLAVRQDRLREGRACYLRALHLILDPLAKADEAEVPEFVPKVQILREALRDSPLPPEVEAALMQHYERMSQFDKAEDCLFALFEADPENEAIVSFGIAFYERLSRHSDKALEAGGLPRTEVEEGLLEFRRRLGHRS